MEQRESGRKIRRLDKLLKKFQGNLNSSTRYIPLFDNRCFALKKLVIFCDGIQIYPLFDKQSNVNKPCQSDLSLEKNGLFTKIEQQIAYIPRRIEELNKKCHNHKEEKSEENSNVSSSEESESENEVSDDRSSDESSSSSSSSSSEESENSREDK